jgi:3'(2'), 5'-bisphosphate nucleotidase
MGAEPQAVNRLDVEHHGKDTALASELAERAGTMLRQLQRVAAFEGWTSERLRAEGDSRSHELLVTALRTSRPQDLVLSEEGEDDLARLEAERVWIIDPLDGTREFSEGRRDWAVHVALWCGGSLRAAAVALPGLAMTLDTADTAVRPETERPRPTRQLRIAVSRTRPPAIVSQLAKETGAAVLPMGSAGYKIAAVVRGEVDAYLHGGGQYEWDSAAPVAVARSRGLHTSRLDGSALIYNQPSAYLPDLLVCPTYMADDLLQRLSLLSGK